MEITNEKKSFFKSKMFIIPMVIFALIAMVTAAVIYINTTTATVTINEAFTQASTGIIAISGYPGETITSTDDSVNGDISIANAADVPLDVELVWTEVSNGLLNPDVSDDVSYTTTANVVRVTIPANSPGELIPVDWTIATDSLTGTFTGTITINRIASI